MNSIEELHEQIFDYLISFNHRIERIGEDNFLFYVRSVRDEKFKKGYWFPGDDESIYITFWDGGDTLNKTPNIYFEINVNQGCKVKITSKDSPLKYNYFTNLIKELNRNSPNRFKANRNKGWSCSITNNILNWRIFLEQFIFSDKKTIDEYVISTSSKELNQFEEFVSKFKFIDPRDFDFMYSRVLKEKDNIKEKELNKHRNFLNSSKLPYALLGIGIENFQGIITTGLNDLPPSTRWIFITGENGYGKTTLLQAIALGLSRDSELEKYLEDKTRIAIELVNHNEKEFPVRTKGGSNILEWYNYKDFVLGYGPSRLNVQSSTSENMESKSNNNVISLFDNETLLKNINYELFASNYSDFSTFEDLEELINIITKGRIVKILVEKKEVLFIEKLSNGDLLNPLPLSKLAAGFRSIINIAFDIYLRFRKVHGYRNYKEFYGIVLIDEIENHLHPILQRELPKALSEVFPEIQFIVSTHSPIPLLAAEKNSVIIKVNREKTKGVEIIRLDEEIDFPNLLPNTILTSPIFGFKEIFSESRDENIFPRIENTYQEVIENDEQKNQIDNFLNDEKTQLLMNFLKK